LQVRQVFGAAAYDSSSMLFTALDDIKPGDVYLRLSDAVQLLEWAWTGYFPGGTAVAAEEVTEMNRRLELWWRQKEGAWGVQNLRMNFTGFERWFCLRIEELIRDRVNFVRDADHYHEHADVFDKHHHHHHHHHHVHGDGEGKGEEEAEASPGQPRKPLPPLVESGMRTPPPGELFDLRNHIDSLLGALEDTGAAGGGPSGATATAAHPPGSPEALLQSYMQRSVLTYDDVDDDYDHDDMKT
jgi:hypothetical protein